MKLKKKKSIKYGRTTNEGGWNWKKNILNKKNQNQKNRDRIWHIKNLKEDEIENKIKFEKSIKIKK